MIISVKEKYLNDMSQNFQDLFDNYKIVKLNESPDLRLMLYFDPVNCRFIKNGNLFNNEIQVAIEIKDYQWEDLNIPILSLSTIFPFRIEMNSFGANFLLGYLFDGPYYPFTQIDFERFNYNGQDLNLLKISCSKTLFEINFNRSEVYIYLMTLLNALEAMVSYYLAMPSNNQ